MEAHSTTSGKSYENWEALVAAEANGWVAVVIIEREKETWPWVVGPFLKKIEATRAAARLRHKAKKELAAGSFSIFVRPAWKVVA